MTGDQIAPDPRFCSHCGHPWRFAAFHKPAQRWRCWHPHDNDPHMHVECGCDHPRPEGASK